MLTGVSYAQTPVVQLQDSTKLIYPFKDAPLYDLRSKPGTALPSPSNVQRTIEFDPVSKQYIIRENFGLKSYTPPQVLSLEEYQRLQNTIIQNDYWKQLNTHTTAAGGGLIPKIVVDNKSFERIFGSSVIDIRPQGSAALTLSGRLNRNENPLFNERQRRQGNFDFNQVIQMNVVGQIGTKMRIATNYNTEAQFDFENQVKLDYTGKPDEIIQKIEAGNVSLPLSSSLITGSQALFGLKTQLQFGKLNVTSIFSSQKSQTKEIVITNGQQQNEFRITADNYDANRHYFLAQYFRNNYNRALANLPIISSNVNITKIEVWISNRNSSNNTITDSRDVLGLIDLGENQPYNTAQVQGGAGFSALPAGFLSPGFTQTSNNLLQTLPPGTRFTNTNDINTYFQANGATDNYSKLTYARKLKETEYSLNPQLGYISLNSPLNADEVLCVAYRYTVNGTEYQVGELSQDIAVDPNTPKVLYVKLLKNETLKTNLPTWDLMMKNKYSLGAYDISPSNFNLQITRADDDSGIEKPLITEGANVNNKMWLQVLGVDNLNQQNDKKPDGYFDFLDRITIDAQNGYITFPTIEPFGSDLARQFTASEQNLVQKYVYQPLYDSTKVSAQQLFARLNRYVIKGTYQSASGSGSSYFLNAINVPQGSVQVFAGTLPLVEGTDFTVDYNVGRVQILNLAMLNSGQQIRIKMENSELFGLQQRSLTGSRFDYRVSDKLNLGGTIMNLSEKPISQKVNVAEEAISNTIWGLDANYSSPSRLLTKLVDRIPFINTKENSFITFSGEYANMIPGHPRAMNFAGASNGTSYLDDFEGSRSIIDIKSAISWQISGTPQLFPESQFTNTSYGFNRARLAFYNLDPIFFNRSASLTPANIRNNKNELSNHYTREVFETEVFPFKQSATGQAITIPTLDLAYYPMVRGPYNFTTNGIAANSNLLNPRSRWGGIFRKLEATDFETLNIEFVEFWVMDPFIYKPNSIGGDLYFNLGNISEDILKDGRKSLENGLPPDGDVSQTDPTVWGRVAKRQPVIQAFDNNTAARQFQDVGLDGIGDVEERQTFSTFLNQVTPQLNPQAAAALTADPASDNYEYYRGNAQDNANAGILKRYERYNGTEGNSKTSAQSLAETGIENSASTSLPDGEDINRDNNSSLADEYFQYKVSIRPQDLVVGQGFITDKVTSNVRLANGQTSPVSWYQFKIPINQYQSKAGNIQDFKSIRFVRMFMTDFADTAILRMARLQLVRGEWRRFNSENTPAKVLADPALGVNPGLDNSTLDVSAVNIEENGTRTPIPYVVPPGIMREKDLSNYRGDTRMNEQSLALNVKNLRDGYARAAFRTTYNDFRSYKRMEMFIHAEGDLLKDKDISAFIRIGADNQDNYYEYQIPLKITTPGSRDATSIWPDVNKLNVELSKLQAAKTARNNATIGGAPWPVNRPYIYADGENTITVLGQPDMSKIRVYMLGVRNPLRNPSAPGLDDGLNKSGQVWFNELRLSDFDERGGWAATTRINAKLADFADVTVSGSKSTIGFGSIDKRVSERNRSENTLFDISSSIELGKFFPDASGIKIPMFINYSSQIYTPQFDPGSPDIELKTALKSVNKAQADSMRRNAEDYTTRRSINFTGVRKIKMDPNKKNYPWDIENFSTTYAYNEYYHRDFINRYSVQKTYKASLDYIYNTTPVYISPFTKLLKAKKADFLRDFNFNLVPSLFSFRINADRLYSENTLRNNDANNFIPIRTTFNKNFLITRMYGLNWNLTKSVQLDFNANNFSIIDEPDGRITSAVRDTIWQRLKQLGRTTDYTHSFGLNYAVPINKLPGLDWVTLNARYEGNFFWKSEPLATLRDPNINFGNNIQNARGLTLNPSLSFSSLYRKMKFIQKAADSGSVFTKRLAKLLTSVISVQGNYSRKEGTFLPGYLPKTNLFGYDLDANAPGWGFLFGSQNDIRGRAIANGWVTRDSLLNQLYFTTRREDMNFQAILEPFTDLQITLNTTKSKNLNYQSNFKYSPITNGFESFSPVTSGDYRVSFFSLKTAFKKQDANGASGLFRQFEANRAIISRRLGELNPNSNGTTAGYADGYDKSSQDVLVASFIAAYTGKDAQKVKLSSFPKIPIPNWSVTYDGLAKYKAFSDIFSTVRITHKYVSQYNINSFSSLVRYQETNGYSSVKDVSNNFLPQYQFSQVALLEQFAPLVAIETQTKTNMSINMGFNKARMLILSLANSQLSQSTENELTFGFGYRTVNFRFPFGLFKSVELKNDLNFKMDFKIRDNKIVIYRADVATPEISSGAKNITYHPSVDYTLSQRFYLTLFYDGNITKPYTSQTFNTSFSNFGVTLKFLLQ